MNTRSEQGKRGSRSRAVVVQPARATIRRVAALFGRTRGRSLAVLQVDEVEILDLATEPRAFRVGSLRAADLGALDAEIARVAAYVERLRSDVAALRVRELHLERLPLAHREVRRVRGAMNDAASRIIAAAKEVLSAPATPDAYRRAVEGGMRAIEEACRFQDLAGQRLGSVEATLDETRRRLAAFSAAIGIADAGAARRPALEPACNLMVEGPGGRPRANSLRSEF